ncbi:S8 family serine peptidase [Salinarimonas sp.]|uniref:S8 family serine peptidase n=1 Tax=Salinarimonas sp. TaxID=2766526 RepID=UPI0032D91FD7
MRARLAACALALAAVGAPLAPAVGQFTAPPPNITPPPVVTQPPRPRITPPRITPPVVLPSPLRTDPDRVRPQTRTTAPAVAPRQPSTTARPRAPAPAQPRTVERPRRPTFPPAAAIPLPPPRGDVFAGAPLPPPRIGSLAAPEPLVGGAFDPLEIEPNVVVAALLPGLGRDAAEALALANDLDVLESASVPLVGALIVRLGIADGRPVDAVASALAGDGRVAYVGPNRIYRTQGAGAQYALAKLGLADAIAAPGTGSGVAVAVIDTAPDLDHPDLAETGVRLESVLAAGAAPAMDHGTQIVGLIAAQGRLRGAAPGADVLAIAAFDADPQDGRPASSTYHLLRALDRAREAGAAVVNMSFAGGEDPLLGQGLEILAEEGVLLVAAAGNGGPQAPPAFPGSHAAVVAVTATDAADAIYAKANRGDYVDIAAPGVDLLAPAAGGRYALGSGTSLAAAYVSAAAALVLERGGGVVDAQAVRAALVGSAVDLGPDGRDPEFGHGLAAPRAALEALAPVSMATDLR